MPDVIGTFLRSTPNFKGKHTLYRHWSQRLQSHDKRIAVLPCGSRVHVTMTIPYERMVWLQNEEWHELQWLKRKLKAGQTFVDIGANIGLWTLVASSAIEFDGRVYSFEPNPSTFRKLNANIELNNRANIVAYQQAVADKVGEVHFHCAAEHNVSAIVNAPNTPDTITVPSTYLDLTLGYLNQCDGIKLDTEGYELPVLLGASQLIERCSPWLIVEFNTTLLPSPKLADWDVYQHLRDLGYTAFLHGRDDGPKNDGSFTLHGYRNILFKR